MFSPTVCRYKFEKNRTKYSGLHKATHSTSHQHFLYILEYIPSVRLVERSPKETKHVLSLHAIIAMAVVGAALILFTVVFIIWLMRVHQEGEDDDYPIRNVNRIVNSLKRVSLPKKEKRKSYSSSIESDEDIEDLMIRKTNNAYAVPKDQPWYKSRKKLLSL